MAPIVMLESVGRPEALGGLARLLLPYLGVEPVSSDQLLRWQELSEPEFEGPPRPPVELKARWHLERIQRPPWADLKAIEAIYAEARETTRRTGIVHHVDHDIPLRGRYVFGLHVETNLKIIPAQDNLRKGRLFEDES